MKQRKKLRRASRKSVKRLVVESEYKKARKNALNRLSYYRTQGYDVSSVKIPDIPKRITSGSIKKLEKVNADYIRKNSKVVSSVNFITGEPETVISGEDYYKIKKTYKKKDKKPKKKKENPNVIGGGDDFGGDDFGGDDFGSDGLGGDFDYPHILDLMRDKIEGMIANYNIDSSSFASMLRDWFDHANMDGLEDRLSNVSQFDLVALDKDLFYISIGRKPKGYGIEAIHNALLGRSMSANDWQKVNEAFDADMGADRFDEESFFGNSDD